MKNDPYPSRSAFTLLEMAIVLVILAVLTHLAVVRLDQGTLKPAQARRLLTDIDRAIQGDPNGVDAEGHPVPNGFLADMGRLPRSLSELWQCPEGARSYGAHQSVDDPSVWVAGGWRGPYLKPRREGERLLDPWGNEIQALPLEDGGIVLLSLGSDGSPNWDGVTESARDMAVTNSPSTCVLSVIPYFYTIGNATNAVEAVETDGEARPTIVHGYSSSAGTILAQHSSVQTVASGVPVQVEGLTPGYGAFRIEREGIHGPVHPVVLHPGTNVVVVTERR